MPSTIPSAVDYTPVTIPPAPARPTPRPRVLILTDASGAVDVYAERGTVDVHIARRLTVDSRDETAADAWLDQALPAKFREIYQPVNLVRMGQCRRLTADQRLQTIVDLQVLAALRDLRNTVQFVAAEAPT